MHFSVVPRRTHCGLSRFPARWLFCILCCSLLFVCSACEHWIGLVEPGAADSTDVGDDGVVQRATLTVTVTVSGEDQVLAELIGSTGGVLRDAEVVVERLESTEGPQTATTDAAGKVQFEELLTGDYSISVIRVLAPGELAQFPSEDTDVNAFGGGRRAEVSAPSTEVMLEAVAGRRGSLVISEVYITHPEHYTLGDFIEVYNNSDTVIHLAGKVIFLAMVWLRDYPSPRSCAEMETWREDPEGIWTRWIYAFPTSGNVCLNPGEAVVVATDAIDHGDFYPGLLDLSDADFEFMGPSDVDNPRVPNMVTQGDHWDPGLHGHGLYFNGLEKVLAVANPVDVGSLPIDYLPVVTPRFWRIPAEKILDVLTASPTPELEAAHFQDALCARFVHERFDRQYAALIDPDALNGIQRRVFTTLPDGRKILLRTRTSARDFLAGAPSPGFIWD